MITQLDTVFVKFKSSYEIHVKIFIPVCLYLGRKVPVPGPGDHAGIVGPLTGRGLPRQA